MHPLALQTSAKGPAKAGDEDITARALQFRGRRQALLASNVANADTPNYKALDANFADSLKQATAAKGPFGPLSVAMTATAAGHIARPAVASQSTLEFVRFGLQAQATADGNSVDMDIERSKIVENAILYRFALMSLDDEAKEFKAAASDPGRR